MVQREKSAENWFKKLIAYFTRRQSPLVSLELSLDSRVQAASKVVMAAPEGNPDMRNEFMNDPLSREIYHLLEELNIQVRKDSLAGPCLALEGTVPTSNGNACVLSIKDDEFPGSNVVEISDEKLLEKLRSVSGQFVHQGLPVFYYEHLLGRKVTTINAQSPRFLLSFSPRVAAKIKRLSNR